MAIEAVQLRGKPVPRRFTKCNGCGSDPLVIDQLERGTVQRCKRKFGFLWKQDYCAVICDNCGSIVGYESPDENYWMESDDEEGYDSGDGWDLPRPQQTFNLAPNPQLVLPDPRAPQAPLMQAPRSDPSYRGDIQFVSASLVSHPEPGCELNQEGIVRDSGPKRGTAAYSSKQIKKVKRLDKEEQNNLIDNEILEGGFLIE